MKDQSLSARTTQDASDRLRALAAHVTNRHITAAEYLEQAAWLARDEKQALEVLDAAGASRAA